MCAGGTDKLIKLDDFKQAVVAKVQTTAFSDALPPPLLSNDGVFPLMHRLAFRRHCSVSKDSAFPCEDAAGRARQRRRRAVLPRW